MICFPLDGKLPVVKWRINKIMLPNIQYKSMEEDINKPQNSKGEFITSLTPAESALLGILDIAGTQNKYLSVIFGSAEQTTKNQLVRIYKVLMVKNRMGACKVFQTMGIDLSSNVYYSTALSVLEAFNNNMESLPVPPDDKILKAFNREDIAKNNSKLQTIAIIWAKVGL